MANDDASLLETPKESKSLDSDAALGGYLVAFSNLEGTVGLLLELLTVAEDASGNIDSSTWLRVQALTEKMGLRETCAGVSRVLVLRFSNDTELVKEWRNLNKRIDRANTARNKLIHSHIRQHEFDEALLTSRRGDKTNLLIPTDLDLRAKKLRKLASEVASYVSSTMVALNQKS